MLDNLKSLNKRTTDWQIAQIKLAGKTAQATLNHSLTAWESTADLAAAAQQDWMDALKPAAK